jgi:hypothetical protein
MKVEERRPVRRDPREGLVPSSLQPSSLFGGNVEGDLAQGSSAHHVEDVAVPRGTANSKAVSTQNESKTHLKGPPCASVH